MSRYEYRTILTLTARDIQYAEQLKLHGWRVTSSSMWKIGFQRLMPDNPVKRLMKEWLPIIRKINIEAEEPILFAFLGGLEDGDDYYFVITTKNEEGILVLRFDMDGEIVSADLTSMKFNSKYNPKDLVLDVDNYLQQAFKSRLRIKYAVVDPFNIEKIEIKEAERKI